MCITNLPASCRICVVGKSKDGETWPGLLATRCENGMKVKTSSLRVLNARKTVLELILSDHPNDCLICRNPGTNYKTWPLN